MLLAIEQGNTNTMFAIHDGASWLAQWRAATESTRTADEYVVWLSQLLSMQGIGFRAIDAVIISSVVPQSIFNLRNLSRRYLNVEPLVIGENAKLGVEVRIQKPSEAGADRLVQPAGSHAFAAAAPSARVRSQCFDGLYHELFNESPELAAPVFALLRQWLLQQCPAKV